MIYDLHILSHPLRTADMYLGITSVAHRWQRSTRAIGGYWLGSFVMSEEDMSLLDLQNFYNTYMGNTIREVSYGKTTWEGMFYEFRLMQQGKEYRRSLTPELWHNKVKTAYTFPDVLDDEAGGAYVYNPLANSFQDASQDFSEWDDGGAGDATYSISVENADGTRAWGFLGVAFTTTNPNDSITILSDQERANAGWNGDTTVAVATYEIHNVLLSGAGQETDWSTNTASANEYGTMEYIVTLGGAAPEAADAMRDAHLAEYAWPRSRKMGGGGGGGKRPTTLEVQVAGYWATLNWLYRDDIRTDTASGMVSNLLASSEFVTVSRISDNQMRVRADSTIPQRIGDLIEDVILSGDLDGNIWQGGVYEDKQFVYEQAPTTVAYYERADGVIVNLGRVPVIPTHLKAGFLLADESRPTGIQPPESSVWDDPSVAYVDEVKFIAPDILQYHIVDAGEGIMVVVRQLESSKFGQFASAGEY